MKRFPFLLVLLASVATAPAGADTPALTWDDCVRLAARHNPALFSAIRAQQASYAQYLGSYNGILPQLSLTNSYTDAYSNGFASSGALGPSESKTWEAQGTASLDLIDFSQWAGIRSALASYRQSLANAQVASSNILLSLYQAFAALLYAQEEVGVNRSIRDLWSQNAQMIALRYDSGAESKGNNMRTQAESLQADIALTQAGRDVRVAQEQLAQALGQDDFSTLAVTGTWSVPAAPPTPPDFAAILDRLPSVQAQRAVVEQTKAAVSVARSALYPKLSFNYNRGWENSSEFPTSNPYWTFTGLVSYPLFGGGPTSAYFNTAAANRAYEKAQEDLRTTHNQARTTLESAWSGYLQAQDQVRVQRSFLDSAIQRKNEADIMYQSGLMTFQDWELIMTDYVNFQKSFLSAEESLISAEGQWRFAIGQQLGE